MVYCVTNVWKSVDAYTVEASILKNGWGKLWPGLMFENNGEHLEQNFIGFRPAKENQLINDLLNFARDLTNPTATDLASRLDEDNIEEWMAADEDASVVHHYTYSVIEQIVISPHQQASEGENSDENEEDVADRVSIDRLIQLTGELLKGLKKRSIITEQKIVNIYIL